MINNKSSRASGLQVNGLRPPLTARLSLLIDNQGATAKSAATPLNYKTETVWNMESESCQSSVTNVIYNLRKKIEPDSRKPTYIKTVLGMGYKFASGE